MRWCHDRPRHSEIVSKFLAVLFLIGFLAVPTDATGVKETVLAFIFVLLGLRALPIVGWSLRLYFFGCLTLAVSWAVGHGVDGSHLSASLAVFCGVTGFFVSMQFLLNVLNTPTYQTALSRFHSSERAGMGKLVYGSFLFGHIVAFGVVPLATKTFSNSRMLGPASRIAAAAFACTVSCSVAFPAVSIALSNLAVSPLNFLTVALPFSLGALVVVRHVIGPRWWRAAGGVTGGAAGGGRPSGVYERPVKLLIWGWLLGVAIIIVLSHSLWRGSLLHLVSCVLICLAFALVLTLGRGERRLNIGRGARYLRSWHYSYADQLVLFVSSGLGLYVLNESGMLVRLLAMLSLLGRGEHGAWVILIGCGATVFLAHLVGVSPIVSVAVLTDASQATVASGVVSGRALVLVLVISTAAALMPSPFSAVNHLRADVAAMRVSSAVREGFVFGAAMWLAGATYVTVLLSMQII